MKRKQQAGFSLIEAMISLAVMAMVMAGLGTMMVHNSRLNKTQQMTTQTQADARNVLSMVVQRIRSAGWDPRAIGFQAVTLDPDLGDTISQIEVRADLNDDDDIDDPFEQLLVRHRAGQIEWRKTVDGSYEVLAINISNDSDGDGTIEPMFVADADPPTRVTVTITAQSAVPDPTTNEFIRYTVSSDVVLRQAL